MFDQMNSVNEGLENKQNGGNLLDTVKNLTGGKKRRTRRASRKPRRSRPSRSRSKPKVTRRKPRKSRRGRRGGFINPATGAALTLLAGNEILKRKK